MGTFFHPITLVAVGGDSRETVEALVDSGSIFSTFPATMLERLGVRPQRVVRLRLANGQVETRTIGEVSAELADETATIICIFGAADAPPIIGAHTLEAFLLAVDPVGQRLVPVEAYWV